MAESSDDNINFIIDQVSSSYGYSELKPQQRSILINFLSGKDVFGCLPTGYGKSLCYLLLPKIFDLLHHKSDGTSIIIVISPLTSLMKDQVAMCRSHNVSAVEVTREEDSKKHYEGVISGKFQIVYISPEMIIGTNKWRSTLQEEKYQSRLCGIIVDEAHCVKKWGGDFRKLFGRLGELRSIVPSAINIMALTATATKTLQREICIILGMSDCVVVEVSPDKPNIFLACGKFESIVETFTPIAERLKSERLQMGRIIIFCKRIRLCSQIYSFFVYHLHKEITEPPGRSLSIPEHRLVDMFTSGTQSHVKDTIIKNFKSPSAPLRIVIATIAFGLGIDCTDVRQVIHLGPSEDIESYVQQIGRCGRDGKPSYALLLYGPKLMENSSKTLINYCKNQTLCRRNFLFFDFECYKPSSSVIGCKCCDVCTKSCSCISCTDV